MFYSQFNANPINGKNEIISVQAKSTGLERKAGALIVIDLLFNVNQTSR